MRRRPSCFREGHKKQGLSPEPAVFYIKPCRPGWNRKTTSDCFRRALLFLLAMSPAVSQSGGVSECSRLAPYFLAADQRVALCSMANTSAPANCARRAHVAPGVSGFDIIEICAGATSDKPGLCIAGTSSTAKYLSLDLRVELCKNALSDAPARCVEHSFNSKRKPRLVVDVCKGASNVAPAECLDMLPQAVSSEDAVELCRTAQTVGPAVCAKARGQVKNGSEVTAGLCKGADGRGPADCFRRSELVMKLSADERVDLCNGARSDAPARCLERVRDRRLGSSEKVLLCRGASGSAPAVCLASLPPSISPRDRAVLCHGAAESHPTAPASCIKSLPQAVSTTSAIALCRGAVDSMAAECAKVARYTVGDSDGLLILCREAHSTVPAYCAQAAVREGADKHLAAIICAQSTSLAPASCFLAAPRQISTGLRAKACAGAQSTTPALCLAAALPRSRRAHADEAACSRDPEIGSLPWRDLDHGLAVRLCKHASDAAAAECGRATPRRMRDNDVELLCAAGGRPDGEATAKCAMSALTLGISSSNAAVLCRGARSNAPVSCFTTATTRINQVTRLAVCAGASSDVPARCIGSISPRRTPSAEEIADCRNALPSPSGLRFTSLGHDGEALYPNQPMHATLEVLDQWGGVVLSDSSSVVRAFVGVQGSNGAFVNAQGRFNTSSEGVAYFSRLSFSEPGSLTLQFSFYRDGRVEPPLVAARVIVAESEHGATVRRCGSIFGLLSCPSGGKAGEEREHAMGFDHAAPTEAVSIVSGGMAAAWSVFTCQSVFEDNGVHVAYLSGGTEPLTASLWYHPGIEALETGVGLPKSGQPAWETLGIERDAPVRHVRRAYYRQSLMWHPDRWVRHAMHSARAQEMFEISSEAYSWMVEEAKDHRRDTAKRKNHQRDTTHDQIPPFVR